MREIKFRAWDKVKATFDKKTKMEYDPVFSIGQVFSISGVVDIKPSDIFSRDDVVWMQYTGLKDKNGKEIYEGDVVKYKDFSEGAYFTLGGRDIQPSRCSVVEMEHLFDGIHLKGAGFIRSQKEAEEKLEVVGNRYENPELLKP